MKKKHNQGFSLVELLIAVAILVMIMVALASFMNTTTGVYTSTRNDIELQKTGQDVYTLLSDKIMQASEIRVGFDGKEYASYGTNGSNLVGADGRLYVRTYDVNHAEQITAVSGSKTGRVLYSFSELKKQSEEEKKSIEYLAILYEQKAEANLPANSEHGAINNPYQQVLDIYYFIQTEDSETMDVYLYRKYGAYRIDSVYNPTDVTSEYSKTASVGEKTGYLEMGEMKFIDMDDEILVPSTSLADDSRLTFVCENVTGAYMYALPAENALSFTLDFEKQNVENTDQSIITLRNSGVLEPRNADVEVYESEDSDEDEAGSSEETGGEESADSGEATE